MQRQGAEFISGSLIHIFSSGFIIDDENCLVVNARATFRIIHPYAAS